MKIRCRSHFLRSAAEAMRRILVDHARARLARKRNGQLYQDPPTLRWLQRYRPLASP
ncbi:MAG: ECF-type sigma factor [bacterium]|nr:ECF-type sigma factor [bacterium]